MARKGLSFGGFYISDDVLFLASAAGVALIGTKLIAEANTKNWLNPIAMEGQIVANSALKIEDRVAAIIAKVSLFKANSLEARAKHSAEIRAIVVKYRPQIAAALTAFRAKMQAYLAGTASRDDFERAKADLKIQIIDIIHLITTEIHESLKVDLMALKAKIQQQRNDIANLRAQGPPWL